MNCSICFHIHWSKSSSNSTDHAWAEDWNRSYIHNPWCLYGLLWKTSNIHLLWCHNQDNQCHHHHQHRHLTPLTTLTCHNGPVWQVAWAYPKFGSLLASHSDGILLQHILLGDSTTKVPSFLNYINYFMGLSNLVFFFNVWSDYELRGYKISVGMAEKSAPRAPPAH